MRLLLEIYVAINLFVTAYYLGASQNSGAWERANVFSLALFALLGAFLAVPFWVGIQIEYKIRELQLGVWWDLAFTDKYDDLDEKRLLNLNRAYNHNPENFRQLMNFKIVTAINKRNNYEYKREKEVLKRNESEV